MQQSEYVPVCSWNAECVRGGAKCTEFAGVCKSAGVLRAAPVRCVLILPETWASSSRHYFTLHHFVIAARHLTAAVASYGMSQSYGLC